MTNDDRPSDYLDEGESDPALPSMGTLVIRTWHEPDQTPGFRARLTFSQNPGDKPGTLSTADPDEILSVVREWLSAEHGPRSEL